MTRPVLTPVTTDEDKMNGLSGSTADWAMREALETPCRVEDPATKDGKIKGGISGRLTLIGLDPYGRHDFEVLDQ